MKTVKVYDATGFITCVGDNYDTIKEEFKNKSKKYGLRFNEDIYSDTMLKCYEAIQKDEGKEIDVIAYFWTSFKYNTINEGKKWINHTVDERRIELFEHFKACRMLFEEAFEGMEVVYEPFYKLETGKEVCRIYIRLADEMDFHRRDDWQKFYGFMARNMMRLERIFNQAKQALE